MKWVVVFDFDGCLVESEEIKDEAFAAIFSEYPEKRDAILRYQDANRHLIRYEKFRIIAEEIVGISYTDAVKEKLTQDFAEYTRREIVACAYVPGALALLTYLQSRGMPMYLSSATPETELAWIAQQRGIADKFTAIYGAPRNKAETLQLILATEVVTPERVIGIGDSLSDLKAARAVGAYFIGRNRSDDFAAEGVPSFDDLHGVLGHITMLMETTCE